MKKIIIIIIFALYSGSVYCQSIERSVIASYGDFSSSSTITISSTVGETIVSTETSSTIILNQGFQQANASAVGKADNLIDDLSITLFPNPTHSGLTIQSSGGAQEGKIEYALFDLNGSLFRSGMFINSTVGSEYTIDLDQLAAGNYILTLSNHKNEKSKSFQIVKL